MKFARSLLEFAWCLSLDSLVRGDPIKPVVDNWGIFFMLDCNSEIVIHVYRILLHCTGAPSSDQSSFIWILLCSVFNSNFSIELTSLYVRRLVALPGRFQLLPCSLSRGVPLSLAWGLHLSPHNCVLHQLVECDCCCVSAFFAPTHIILFFSNWMNCLKWFKWWAFLYTSKE